jgi:hypothetical protein
LVNNVPAPVQDFLAGYKSGFARKPKVEWGQKPVSFASEQLVRFEINAPVASVATERFKRVPSLRAFHGSAQRKSLE